MAEPAAAPVPRPESGRVPLLGLLRGLGAASFQALLLGVAYGAWAAWWPLSPASVAGLLVTGGLLGLQLARAARGGHLRRRGLLPWLGLGIGALGLYASWVGWFLVHSQGTLLALGPRALWMWIHRVGAIGTWELDGHVVAGQQAWTYWAAEALVLLGGVALVAWWRAEAAPYCEGCGAWSQERARWRARAPEDEGALDRALAEAPADALDALLPSPEEASSWLELRRYDCPGGEAFLVLTRVTRDPASLGGMVLVRRPLGPPLELGAARADALAARLGASGSAPEQ